MKVISSLLLILVLLLAFLTGPARAQSSFGIDIAKQEAGVQVTWSGGILQSAPVPGGPWTSLPAAVSPHQVNSLQSKGFFRVQRAFPLTLAKNGTGTGTVRSTALAMVCGAECSRLIPQGTTVTLEAIPDAGSTFTGWSGDGTGTTTRQVTLSAARTVTATFTSAVSSNPIINGDFELGSLSGWTQQPGQSIYTGTQLGITPYSGQYVARLGWDQANNTYARIGQQITLPATGPVILNFAYWIHSEELCDVPYYDSFSVYAGAQRVAWNDYLCSSNGTNGWQRYSVDLSAMDGQTINLVFSVNSADNLASIVLLDDIAISNQP